MISDWIRERKDLLKGAGIILGIFIGIAGILNIFFLFASYHPKFCTACHIMKPYYKQWETSKHKEVACIKCHKYSSSFALTATLKYLTETYSPRPHAVMDDTSCVSEGCHSSDPGSVLFKKRISFDHKQHLGTFLRVEKLRCSNCHFQIVQGKHITVPEEICYLCHFKGTGAGQAIGGCPSCHGVPSEPVEHEGFLFSHESYLKIGVTCEQCHIEVKKGDGGVPGERCTSCHPEREKPSLSSLHLVHVMKRNFDCFVCHKKIQHGLMKLPGVLEVKCEACHKRLHSPQKEMYMGVGGVGVPDTPSRMFAAQVSCEGCHIKPVEKKEARAIPGIRSLGPEKKACVNCHGKGYDTMLEDWIREVSSALQYTEKRVNNFKRWLSRFNSKKIPRNTLILLKDAERNIELVKEGRGVHNVEYAVKLMKVALDQIESGAKFVTPYYKEPPAPPLLSTEDGYCTRLCHSRLGIPDEVYFKEMRIKFPHYLHPERMKVKCTDCHSADKHKMRIITKEGCLSCHHKGGEDTCIKCHPYQIALYKGRVKGFDYTPDPMFVEGVGCLDCHDIKTGPLDIREVTQRCIECHDETYGEVLKEWMDELLKIESELTLKVAVLNEKVKTLEKMGKKVRQDLKKQLAIVNKYMEYVSIAKGVHNYELIEKIASRVENIAHQLDKEIK